MDSSLCDSNTWYDDINSAYGVIIATISADVIRGVNDAGFCIGK